MRQLGERHEPLHAAQVDERPEVRQGGDGPGQHCARGDFLPRLLGRLGGTLLEQATAGEDQVAPVVAERRDAEFQDAADVLFRRIDAAQVHLRERTEAAQAADRHLVAALDHRGHLALDRNAGLRGHGQRLARLRALPELVRKSHLVPGRDDGGLDLVAQRDLQASVLVGQLGALDPGLALAADVDEDALGRDVDDAALHDLAHLEDWTSRFAGEHRGEIFGVAHPVTLGAPPAGGQGTSRAW